MSNRIIGIGVVVAGFVASAAVTAYVMREPGPVPSTSLAGPELESATTPGAPVSGPSEPEVQVPSVVAAPVRRTTPSVARTPSPAPIPDPVSPVVDLVPASAPSVVIDPPRSVPPPIDPPKYVPDPISTPQAPAPAVIPEPEFDEVTVERHSVIGIRLDYAVSSRTASLLEKAFSDIPIENDEVKKLMTNV